MTILSSNIYEKNKGEEEIIKRCDIQLRMHILDDQTLKRFTGECLGSQPH